MPKNPSARLVFALFVLTLLGFIVRNLYRRYLSSHLIAAVEIGNAAAVRGLLARGADPNSHKPPVGNTGTGTPALSLATDVYPSPSPGQEAIACLLIQRGADISAGRGDELLRTACGKGSVAIARCLLEHGVDPNATDAYRRTPLEAAISYILPHQTPSSSPPFKTIQAQQRSVGAQVVQLLGEQAQQRSIRIQMVQLLREHGARLNLWQAARIDDADALRAALNGGTPVDEKQTPIGFTSLVSYHGPTALMIAVQEGSVHTARLLLAQGANVNAQSTDPPYTPLIAAITGKQLELARLLLQHGADANLPLRNVNPPLVDACSELPQLVPELLQRGVNLKTCGSQALNAALQNNHPELIALLLPAMARQGGRVEHSVLQTALQYQPACVPLLLAQGADAQETPRESNGLLSYALHFERRNLIVPLLRAGANVNAPSGGITPLMEAIGKGADMINFLLTNGADLNKTDRFGRSPLLIAAQAGDVEVVRTLLKHGAAVNGTHKGQHTPLYYARRHNHPEVAALLQQAGEKE